MQRQFEEKIDLGNSLIYKLPPMPPEREIEGYELASAKQKFKRHHFMGQKEFDKLSKESRLEITTQQLLRRSEGYWFFVNGIPTYITGSTYFYLHYWYINALTIDGLPEYRWAQTKMGYFYDYCEQDRLCFGGILLSAKRFSKTEYALAYIYNKSTLFRKGMISGLIHLNHTFAKDKLFKEKVMRSHKHIKNYLKPVSNETKSKKDIVGELTFMSNKDDDQEYSDSLNNKIGHRPTTVSCFQGETPQYVYVDEAGTIDEMDLTEWHTTTRNQLLLGKYANGKMWLPCTLENMTNKGAKKFEALYKESDPNKRDKNGRTISWLYPYFNPQYEGREDFIDEYGYSRADEAKEYRQNELDVSTPEKARKLKRQYPETVQEAFDVIVSKGLETDVIEILKKREQYLIENTDSLPYFQCTLFPDPHGKIEYTPIDGLNENVDEGTDEGKDTCPHLIIYELPQPYCVYKIGVDSTGTDNTTGDEDGSMFAFSVLKAFQGPTALNYHLVAQFARRPEKMEDCYKILLYAARLYNLHGVRNDKFSYTGTINGILPERNAGGGSAVAGYVSERGHVELLMETEKDKFGIYRDQHVKQNQLIKLNIFLTRYGHQIPSLLMIRDFLNIGRRNADRADGFMMAVLALGNFEPPPVETPKPQRVRRRRRLVFRADGTSFHEWYEVPTPNGQDDEEKKQE